MPERKSHLAYWSLGRRWCLGAWSPEACTYTVHVLHLWWSSWILKGGQALLNQRVAVTCKDCFGRSQAVCVTRRTWIRCMISLPRLKNVGNWWWILMDGRWRLQNVHHVIETSALYWMGSWFSSPQHFYFSAYSYVAKKVLNSVSDIMGGEKVKEWARRYVMAMELIHWWRGALCRMHLLNCCLQKRFSTIFYVSDQASD